MALVAMLIVGLAPVTHAATETSHSGQLVDVGPGGHQMTLRELGPWDGHHQAIRVLSIRLTSRTTIESVGRVHDTSPGGWVGGFRETPASLAQLRPGQYVTIRAQLDPQHHLVADTVQIIRPDEARDAKS